MKITKTLTSILFLLVLPSASFAADYKLVYYSDIQPPAMIDQLPSGPSIGDMYVRNAPVRSSENGPVIGEYFSQATIIYLDLKNEKSARSYQLEAVLPEGTLYHMDLVQLDHGDPIKEGHKHTGAIIGGTGKYAGIRGTYEIEMMKGGHALKVTNHYWLGQ
jgi:hypothetical protein